MKKNKCSDFCNVRQNGGEKEILRMLDEDSLTSTLHDTVLVFRDGMVKTHSVILASISKILKNIMEAVQNVETKYIIIPSLSIGTWTQFVKYLLSKGKVFDSGSLVGELMELIEVLGVRWEPSHKGEMISDDLTIKLETIEEDAFKEEFHSSVCENSFDMIGNNEDEIHLVSKSNKSTDHRNNRKQEVGTAMTKTSKCIKCRETFEDRYALKNHLFASPCSGKSQYELTAIAASLAIIEEKVVNRRKLYECKVCNYQTKIREHMMNHCQKHTKMYCTKCDQCGKMFRDKGTLKHHIASDHVGLKMFKCTDCGNEFVTKTALTVHSRIHNELELLKCESEGCDFTNSNKYKVALHFKRKHESNNSLHLCSECGKGFTTKSELKVHFERKHSELKHLCIICPAKYGSEKLLKDHVANSHMKIHEPRQCELCPKLLKNIESLRQHMKSVHTPDEKKAYQCNICGKGFIKKDNWIMHMNGHQGIKPIECEQCGQQFARKPSYIRHLTIHDGTNKFSCTYCSRIFTQAYDVKRHMDKDHNSSADLY